MRGSMGPRVSGTGSVWAGVAVRAVSLQGQFPFPGLSPEGISPFTRPRPELACPLWACPRDRLVLGLGRGVSEGLSCPPVRRFWVPTCSAVSSQSLFPEEVRDEEPGCGVSSALASEGGLVPRAWLPGQRRLPGFTGPVPLAWAPLCADLV